jgi:hypothetical protein
MGFVRILPKVISPSKRNVPTALQAPTNVQLSPIFSAVTSIPSFRVLQKIPELPNPTLLGHGRIFAFLLIESR